MSRQIQSRRGRVPVLMLKTARLLSSCIGWENGLTIGEIAREVYGRDTAHNRQKARLLIGSVRRLLNVDIFSITPVGETERRYCNLSTQAEYTKAINNFIKHIRGSEKTKRKLEKAKLTIEARRRLKAIRKARKKQQ